MPYQLLKKYRTYLTAQQYKTLKGQIKSGDEYGAIKGLNKILFSKGVRITLWLFISQVK